MLLDTRPVSADTAAVEPSPAPSPVWAADIAVTPGAELWVFGYGSLMWNPGFPHLERQPAVLKGYHRHFCVTSYRYRGTPDNPGLVLGLDRGGACRGIAFRVAAAEVPCTLDYLWEREMSTRVYRPKLLPVRLPCGRSVTACAFVVDRAHGQYCGDLDEGAAARRIAGCCGDRGPNLEYLVNTVEHLEALGIRDARLIRLLDAARRGV